MFPGRGRSALAPPSANDFAGARLLRAVTFPALATAALLGIWGAIELSPLFADGFYYLLRILQDEGFFMPAPARRMVEVIRQPPVLAAMVLGVRDVAALGVIFGLCVQLAPLALMLASWALLPRERKIFFVFPLLHFCAGTLSTWAAPINEGPTAAAYFWVLFYGILFLRARTAALGSVAVLAAGTLLLHEAMVFLGPILALAALWRARREDARFLRIAFALLAAWFVIVAVVQARFILEPSDPENRASFLRQLFSFWWIAGPGGINLPAIVGMAGLAAIGAAALLQFGVGGARRRSLAWMIVAGLALACAAALAYAAWSGHMHGVPAQFHARNHALLLSLPLSLLALYALMRPGALHLPLLRQSVAVCGIVAAVSLAWHAYATHRWSLHVAAMRDILAAHRGFVHWDATMAPLSPERRQLMSDLSHHWVLPSMSIILAPDGRVSTILWSPHHAFNPFDPRDPAALPRSRYWSYECYLEAVAAQKAAGELRQ